MAQLTPRARRVLWGLGALYALVNGYIGIHSGGDLVSELRLTERLLHGLPLYATVDTARGLPWPPFATVALIPFALIARVSLPVAKGLWAVGNVALFGWCLVQAFSYTRRWRPVVLAVAAIAQPLQSNFQHLNVNLVLLGLVCLAIRELEAGRELRAALWIGVATALKGYPGAIFLYFLARGRWRPLGVGIVAALGMTLLAGLPYGLAGWGVVRDYVQLALVAGSTQALLGQPIGGLVARLGGGVAAAVALDLVSAGAVAAVLWYHRSAGEPVTELGMSAVLAVLLAPLDRLHFYVLAFPAWIATLAQGAPTSGPTRLVWRITLALGALLTSGMLSHITSPLPDVLSVIRQNTYILGALLLLAVLVVQRARAPVPGLVGEPR
jgi:alpha-1,2-mannosyltransferase